MKPTLPTTLLRSHAKNKKMQERMTISPLYLSSCAEFIAANTYASVTPLIPYKIFKSKEQLFIDEEISKKKKDTMSQTAKQCVLIKEGPDPSVRVDPP